MDQSDKGEITSILRDVCEGRLGASERLIPLVYEELRRIAAALMRRERMDHTLQATALVNEAFIRLVEQREQDWKDRAHFFGVAAHLMRLILVDYARKHCAHKRSGGRRVQLEKIMLFSEEQFEDLIALDEALERLGTRDPRMLQVVELQYFADLSVREIAAVLRISERTVKRDWRVARIWLHKELTSSNRHATTECNDG